MAYTYIYIRDTAPQFLMTIITVHSEPLLYILNPSIKSDLCKYDLDSVAVLFAYMRTCVLPVYVFVYAVTISNSNNKWFQTGLIGLKQLFISARLNSNYKWNIFVRTVLRFGRFCGSVRILRDSWKCEIFQLAQHN